MNSSRKKNIYKLIGSGIFLLIFVSFMFYLASLVQENEALREAVVAYGYPGILVVSLLTGFNLAVPIPAISFLPLFVESGLDFWTTIAVITVGVTIADMIAYFLGKFGFELTSGVSESRVFKKLASVHERYSWSPPLFLFFFAALAPIPNEVMVIPMGFLGYRLIHILPSVLLGNFIFNLLYSTGVITVFEFL